MKELYIDKIRGSLMAGAAGDALGYAVEFISRSAILKRYGADVLGVRQIWASVASDNDPSIALFEGCGFDLCGIRREWLRRGSSFVDEREYQCLL